MAPQKCLRGADAAVVRGDRGKGWQQLACGRPRAFPCSLFAEFRESSVWFGSFFVLFSFVRFV